MTALAWPIVALVGLVLAYLVAMRFASRSKAQFATREEFTKLGGLQKDFNAEIEKGLTRVEEELAKTQARIPAQPGDRSMPFGLRRGGT